MKRSVKSLILLGVLLVLLGSYSLVNRMNQQAEVSEEAGNFALIERSADELTGIRWTSDEGENHFVKDDEGWSNAEDADFPTNQEAVQEMADRLMSMTATRKLSNVEKAEDYGFADESFTVTAEWSDGASTSYMMGDETPFADGYYLRIDGDEGVIYTTTSALSAMFAETSTDLAELEEIGKVETALSLNVGENLSLTRHAESISIDPDQHWYAQDGEPMDDEAVEALISEIEALEWNSLLKVSASEEELLEYGLDDQSAALICVLGDDDDNIELLIGSMDEDGAYYARLPDSNRVYTLDAESVESILNIGENTLWNDVIFPLSYEQVQSFACTLNGGEMRWEKAAADDAAEESEETEESSEAADPNEEIWEQICALYATGHSETEPSGEALLKISVTSTTDVSAQYAFYEFDVDSYIVVVDESRKLLVSADEIDKLIRTLKQ